MSDSTGKEGTMGKIKAAENRGFTQGVGWAARYLIDGHGEDSLVEFLLGESGIPLRDFRKFCDPSDYEIVKKYSCRITRRK